MAIFFVGIFGFAQLSWSLTDEIAWSYDGPGASTISAFRLYDENDALILDHAVSGIALGESYLVAYAIPYAMDLCLTVSNEVGESPCTWRPYGWRCSDWDVDGDSAVGAADFGAFRDGYRELRFTIKDFGSFKSCFGS